MQRMISPAITHSLSPSLSLSRYPTRSVGFSARISHSLPCGCCVVYPWFVLQFVDAVQLAARPYVPSAQSCLYTISIYHVATAYPGFEPRPGQLSWPKTRLAFLGYLLLLFLFFLCSAFSIQQKLRALLWEPPVGSTWLELLLLAL